MTHLFISHASDDDKTVNKINAKLTAAKIDTWVDHDHGIKPSAVFPREIDDAVNGCEYGLFVLSHKSARSDYCLAEYNRILNLGKPLYVAMIDPLLLHEIPLRLDILHRVDLTKDFNGGMAELISAIKGKREPDVKTPYVVQGERLTGRFPYFQLDLPLIGRDADLTAVKTLLDQSSRPAVVAGLGGVGKTRLVAEIADTVPFRDGVIWQDLRLQPDFSYLIQLIRDHFQVDSSLDADVVWASLGQRAALIVLDNGEDCAQRAEFARRIADLNLGGGTRIVLASRYKWAELDHLPAARTKDLAAPDLPSALKILGEMVRLNPPQYPLNRHEEEFVQAAHRHPRMMQYALGWLNKRPLTAVLQTLHDLKGIDAEKMLDDLIERTITQLETEEHGAEALAALKRLAVCRGGFTYEAAENILGEGTDPALLSMLIDWRLVSLADQRHDIDPLVIAAVGEDEDAHWAHYDHFLTLAERHDTTQDYLGLDIESANLEAAFEWALVSDAEDALRLANACGNFLANRGRFEQRKDWLERVAAALANDPDQRLQAAVLNSLGIVYQNYPTGDRRDNLQRAVAANTEALRFYTPQAAPLDYATTQNNLGNAYCDLAGIEDRAANLQRAVAAYTEALRFYTPQAAPLDYAMTQNNLAIAYCDLAGIEERTANLQRAVATCTDALRFYTPQAAPLDYAMTQNNLGNAYSGLAGIEDQAANLQRAVATYTEALRFYTPQAAPRDYAGTQHGLGVIHEDLGDLPAAVACWREAEKYFRQMGYIEQADLMLQWIADAGGTAQE